MLLWILSVNEATVASVDSGDAAADSVVPGPAAGSRAAAVDSAVDPEVYAVDSVSPLYMKQFELDPVEEPVDWVSSTPIAKVAAVDSVVYACHRHLLIIT